METVGDAVLENEGDPENDGDFDTRGEFVTERVVRGVELALAQGEELTVDVTLFETDGDDVEDAEERGDADASTDADSETVADGEVDDVLVDIGVLELDADAVDEREPELDLV